MSAVESASPVLGPDLAQKVFKKLLVYVKEFDQPDDIDVRTMITPCVKKKTTAARALLDVLQEKNLDSRKYGLKCFEVDAKKFVELNADIDPDDVSRDDSPPELLIWLTAAPGKFSHAAFLKNDGNFKKFVKVAGYESFVGPRKPQEEALLQLRKVLQPARPGQRFMIILPTGLGKTTVMALSPFMLDVSKVLFIAPGLTIGDQIYEAISNFYTPNHPIGKTGEVNVLVKKFSTGDRADIQADAIATNIQALVRKKKAGGGDDDAQLALAPQTSTSSGESRLEEDDDDDGLTEGAKSLLQHHKPDLIVIDEGHHFPASSWEKFTAKAKETNPSCKFVLLTATPQRGDGATYGLTKVTGTPDTQYFYLFTRQQAIRDGYIKNITFHKIEPVFVKPGLLVRYEEKEYIKQIIYPAVQMLRDLRESCKQPVRLLVNARTNAAAASLAPLINKWSEFEKWGLHAQAITGAQGQEANKQALVNYACLEAYPGQKMVDIAVQCRMLGEGYDNPLIAVTAFVAPAKSVGTLSQMHGRAIRKPPFATRDLVRAMESHMFYPDETDSKGEKAVHLVVEEYRNGVDESLDSLFAALAFKSLKHAHTKIGQCSTDDAVQLLAANFLEYHEKYEEKRASWKPIPAEELADEIYQTRLGDGVAMDLRIVDFGCGDVGLFENKLAELVAERDASGTVHVLALDVVKLDCAAQLTALGAQPHGMSVDDKHTTFTCASIAGNYNVGYDPALHGPLFNVGVFCLSFMAQDSIELGLRAAAQMIEPEGVFYVVLDLWKFGIHPTAKKLDEQNSMLAEWCKNFTEKTGFNVEVHNIRGRPKFAYLKIRNINKTQQGNLDGIAGITLKELRGDESAQQVRVPAQGAGIASRKRALGGAFGQAVSSSKEPKP